MDSRIHRENIHKFIVYILKVSFKSLSSWVHTPDNLPDAGTNIMGTHSNIECMISSPNNTQPAAHVQVSSCL